MWGGHTLVWGVADWQPQTPESQAKLLLGSLLRSASREVAFLSVLPTSAESGEVRSTQRALERLAEDQVRQQCQVEVVQSDDVRAAVSERAEEADLLILGVQRHGHRNRLFGDFTRAIAQQVECPMIVMSSRS